MGPNENRFSVPIGLLHSQLGPFLSKQYKLAVETATQGLHTDTMELIDRTLSILLQPVGHFLPEEVVAFFISQGNDIAKSASAVCEAWEKNETVPFHRIMVYARRYLKVNSSPTFYDVTKDAEIKMTEQYAPVESVNYVFGAIYAYVLQQRKS